MNVLYLSEWYPHRYDAMAGLFVQKHAIAAANAGVDVCVLYLHHDTHIQQLEITDNSHHQIREIIVYYPTSYLAALRKGWQYVKSHWGKPNVCQLNVITRNAILPLWLKLRYKIPYIIVEHWSGYLPENGTYAHSAKGHHRMAQATVRNASQVLAVSQKLAECMQSCGLQHPHYGNIDNVVDDFFFDIAKKPKTPNKKKQLLHVSCFDERAKNVKGLLRAVHKLSERRDDFELVLVGTGQDYADVRAFADHLNIPQSMLRWTGELEPKEVAEELHKADAFVLSSRYETYGVVFGEALAAGVPILSTPVGIAEELPATIVPQEIAQDNPKRFADYIEDALWPIQTESVDYSQYAKRFSAKVIGEQLKSIYESCITQS